MKIEQYFAACKPIHTQLAAIAERTKNMALTSCANSSHPDWIELMEYQDALLSQLAELDQQYLE